MARGTAPALSHTVRSVAAWVRSQDVLRDEALWPSTSLRVEVPTESDNNELIPTDHRPLILPHSMGTITVSNLQMKKLGHGCCFFPSVFDAWD